MARLQHEQETKAYRVYVSDTLWGIAHGKALDKRLFELIGPQQPEDTRTADEVIAHIKQKLEEVGQD